MTVAINGYLTGEHAPGRCSDRSMCAEGNSATEPYIAAHNMLNAHAAAVQVTQHQILWILHVPNTKIHEFYMYPTPNFMNFIMYIYQI